MELETLWIADKLDVKQIIAKVKEINELKNKLEIARVNHRIEIAQILTPQQRKLLWELGPGKGMKRRMMKRERWMRQREPLPREPE